MKMELVPAALLLLGVGTVLAEPGLEPGEESKFAPVCARIARSGSDSKTFLRQKMDSFQVCKCTSRVKATCDVPLPSANFIGDPSESEAAAIANFCKTSSAAGGVCHRGRERGVESTPFCDCAINSTDILGTIPGFGATDPETGTATEPATETSTAEVAMETADTPSPEAATEASTVEASTQETTELPVRAPTERGATVTPPSEPASQPTTPVTESPASIELFRAEALCQVLKSDRSPIPYSTFRRTFASSWTRCRCQDQRWAVCEPDHRFPTVRPGSPAAVLAAEKGPAHNAAFDQILLASSLFALQQFCRQSFLAGEPCASQEAGVRSSCDCAKNVTVDVADVEEHLLPTEPSTDADTESGTSSALPPNSEASTTVSPAGGEAVSSATTELSESSETGATATICSRMASGDSFRRTTFEAAATCVCVDVDRANCTVEKSSSSAQAESGGPSAHAVASADHTEFEQRGLAAGSVMKKHHNSTKRMTMRSLCRAQTKQGRLCVYTGSRGEEPACDCRV